VSKQLEAANFSIFDNKNVKIDTNNVSKLLCLCGLKLEQIIRLNPVIQKAIQYNDFSSFLKTEKGKVPETNTEAIMLGFDIMKRFPKTQDDAEKI
jgi:hypothetical protein